VEEMEASVVLVGPVVAGAGGAGICAATLVAAPPGAGSAGRAATVRRTRAGTTRFVVAGVGEACCAQPDWAAARVTSARRAIALCGPAIRGGAFWKYHRNQECLRVWEVRGARGATRPTASAVKVGRVVPRAPWSANAGNCETRPSRGAHEESSLPLLFIRRQLWFYSAVRPVLWLPPQCTRRFSALMRADQWWSLQLPTTNKYESTELGQVERS